MLLLSRSDSDKFGKASEHSQAHSLDPGIHVFEIFMKKMDLLIKQEDQDRAGLQYLKKASAGFKSDLIKGSSLKN